MPAFIVSIAKTQPFVNPTDLQDAPMIKVDRLDCTASR